MIVVDYLRDREKRTQLMAFAYICAVAVSAIIGGMLLHAMIVFSCVYIGTLITLWRVPSEVPERTPSFLKPAMAGLVKVRNFLMEHDLVTTILLGVVATSIVSVKTVTGLTVIALCAMFGDMVVHTFHRLASKIWPTKLVV